MLPSLTPTALRFDGLRVSIYSHDHRLAHDHVVGAGGEAVFLLNCPGGPLELRELRGFDRRRLERVVEALGAHLTDLCDRWRTIHGDH